MIQTPQPKFIDIPLHLGVVLRLPNKQEIKYASATGEFRKGTIKLNNELKIFDISQRILQEHSKTCKMCGNKKFGNQQQVYEYGFCSRYKMCRNALSRKYNERKKWIRKIKLEKV